MNTLEELQAFLARHAADMNANTIPEFLRCFDEDAVLIDHATASANWPSRDVGDLTAQTPQAGNGHYARIQMKGLQAGQHGEAVAQLRELVRHLVRGPLDVAVGA